MVYVDYDPVVLAHARALLTSTRGRRHASTSTPTCATPARSSARPRELLDFTKPVAVTLLMILHVIPDSDDPHAIVAKVMDALPPGSYLAVSHLGAELLDQEKTAGL